MGAASESGGRVLRNASELVNLDSERIVALKSEIDTERRHLATKAELERMSSTLTWRMILLGAIFQAIGIGAIKYLP